MNFDHIDDSNEMVKKIIKTSFEVFALNDYNKASTNMIVKKAGVSRGILYHYFKDKEELFDYLNYYSLQKSFKEIDEYIDWANNDLIKRISEITKYRLDGIAQYPFMIEFGEKYRNLVFKYADVGALREWREKFYTYNIDYKMFKDGMELDKVLHILKWTYRGLYKGLLEKPDTIISETMIGDLKESCNSYYELLVSSFYK